MSNPKLLEMAMYNLEKMAEMEKESFEPMMGGQPGAQQAPAGGEQPPVDPAQMAAMAGGGAPVDPMAAGGPPAAGSPPPAAAPAAPSSPDPAMMDQLVQAVRQVMQESGGMQGNGGKGKGAGGKDSDERLSAVEAALAQVLQVLNLASPQQAVSDAVAQAAQPQGDVMSAGSGQPSDGAGSVPAVAGALDPNAGMAMGEIGPPPGLRKMGAAPLDSTVKGNKIAAAVRNARRR